jgi:hypothetical protein
MKSSNFVPAGDFRLPSKEQHDFCLANYDFFRSPAILNAANMVMMGYSCNEMVPVGFVRIVNDLISRFNSQI